MLAAAGPGRQRGPRKSGPRELLVEKRLDFCPVVRRPGEVNGHRPDLGRSPDFFGKWDADLRIERDLMALRPGQQRLDFGAEEEVHQAAGAVRVRATPEDVDGVGDEEGAEPRDGAAGRVWEDDGDRPAGA